MNMNNISEKKIFQGMKCKSIDSSNRRETKTKRAMDKYSNTKAKLVKMKRIKRKEYKEET